VWDSVAYFYAESGATDIAIGRFDCESPMKNRELCDSLGVSEYPGFGFFGFIDNAQSNPHSSNTTKEMSRPIWYSGDPFMSEQLRDWTRALRWVSKVEYARNGLIRWMRRLLTVRLALS